MEKFEAESIAEAGKNLPMRDIKYKVIENIKEFEKSCGCIIVKNLDPDYSILLGSLKLIITEAGSPLAHLAIVGREQNIPILLVEDIISKIPKTGKLSVKGNIVEVKEG